MVGRKEDEAGLDRQSISQLGTTIQAWRRYRRLSTRALATRAGLGEKRHSYISKIEHGSIQHPNRERLLAIARALGITSDELRLSRQPPTDNPLAPLPAATPFEPPRFSAQQSASTAEQQPIEHTPTPILDALDGRLRQMEDRLKRSLQEVMREEMRRIGVTQPLPAQSRQAGKGRRQSDAQIPVDFTRPPLIGIPCYAGERAGTLRPLYGINRIYVEALERAGGTAILIPHTKNITALYPLCTLLQGLLLPGGADIDPLCYHDEPHPALGRTDPEEDRLDLALVAYFLEKDLPILGISRGMQLINIARGGTLYQDIASQRPESLRHNYDYTPRQVTYLAHPIAIKPHSLLARLLGTEPLMVNSFHHQAINKIGWDLAASAWAPDGIIEGLESPHHRFVVGVQFQAPELALQEDRRVMRLFQEFIKVASRVRRAPW